MSSSDSDMRQDTETLEHLLGVVVENREKRCQQMRDNACQQATEITRTAYAKGRVRMHHHTEALREKSRQRVASANARNQTLLRQQRQKADRAVLDVAWPQLREAMLVLWRDPASRHKWLEAAISSASKNLRLHGWHIEHPSDMSVEDKERIKLAFIHGKGKHPKLSARDDIEAGIRITVKGTVIDATLDGLLQQKTAIEARLIARIKQEANGHE